MTALAVAAVVALPPVSVTDGVALYPAPPRIMMISDTYLPADVVEAVITGATDGR
jgi:hypothetical protein